MNVKEVVYLNVYIDKRIIIVYKMCISKSKNQNQMNDIEEK